MTRLAFLLVITGVLLNAAAQLFLKAATAATGPIALSARGGASALLTLLREPSLWGGLTCYGISVVVWILALSRAPVSIAYPMLSIGYIVNLLAAAVLFREPLTLQKIVAVLIICLGVTLLARSS
jgi:multidrug transporter EmrE-like cation transporter